jgi:hypothetical protein
MRTATWFGLWAVVGVAGALGVLAVLTIGMFVLPAAAAFGAVLAWRAPRWLAVPGVVAGLALPLFYVGYLNRDGPAWSAPQWQAAANAPKRPAPGRGSARVCCL